MRRIGRTAGYIALPERNDTARRDQRSVDSFGRIINPAPAVCTTPVPLNGYSASTPVNEYVEYALVIEYVAPTSAVLIRVPVKKTMGLRDIAMRSWCEQRKLLPFF